MSQSPLPPDQREFDDLVNPELYENSPDCIKILRLDGTIKRVNPGGQVALELDRSDQLDDTDWPSLWPGSARPRVQQAIEEARDGKRAQFLAFCPTAKNNPRWWDVVVTPMPHAAASVGGLLVVSRDVTELVQAREALMQANERKNEFLTVLSHELRNPLSALRMAGQLLGASLHEPAKLSNLSDVIARQVGHISRLAEDLLDISRITRGQVSLHVQRLDVRDVVRDAAEQLASTLAPKQQALTIQMADAPVFVDGDRMRLTQVLGNLLGNASRYSPARAPIGVALAVADGCALLTVSDEGQGIPDELMPRLFDTYVQGDPAVADGMADGKAAGVGLGLAIVKGLLDLHGGTIRAESAGAGQGSRFVVSLPLAAIPG